MNGDLSFGDAFAQIFWYVGEIAFKFVPGTVATLAGTSSGGSPIPTGVTPITEPVTTASIDRKSTRLNSSHMSIPYAGFCLKKDNTRRYAAAKKRKLHRKRATEQSNLNK